jgi:hypothetical protein
MYLHISADGRVLLLGDMGDIKTIDTKKRR